MKKSTGIMLGIIGVLIGIIGAFLMYPVKEGIGCHNGNNCGNHYGEDSEKDQAPCEEKLI